LTAAAVVVAVGLLIGCRGGHEPSATYRDGYFHGPEAFQAEPLVNKSGGPVARPHFRKACREVGDFYQVGFSPDWITGCIDGALNVFK
jgi:hypothetical protein